jgi:hypothetical protein
MTVTTHDVWFPNATSVRLVEKRVTVALTAEVASITAAALGLAEVWGVSNAVGANGVGYAGLAAVNGSAAYFYTDGAGAAWTGAAPTLTTSLTFTVLGVPAV